MARAGNATAADKPTATVKPAATKPAPLRVITTDYVEALKAYAEIYYKAGMGGKDCKRMEEVAAKIEMGRDIGLPASQALANIQIVNGRPSIYGDAALALVRSKGVLDDCEETIQGDGDDMTAVCRVVRVGAKRERVERYSVADAKRAGLWGKAGPWQTAPKRMLMFRARGFALRDEFGDVLMGLILVEEAWDIPEEKPRVTVPVAVQTVEPAKPDALPAGEPTAAPAAPSERTRDELLTALARLRESLMTAEAIDDPSKQRERWAAVVTPYGKAKASELDAATLAKLVHDLEKLHDPSHGRRVT